MMAVRIHHRENDGWAARASLNLHRGRPNRGSTTAAAFVIIVSIATRFQQINNTQTLTLLHNFADRSINDVFLFYFTKEPSQSVRDGCSDLAGRRRFNDQRYQHGWDEYPSELYK